MRVVISLPDAVFDAADRLARELHVSRSRLYAEALTAFVAERGAAAVTQQLNQVYSTASDKMDCALAKAQLRTLSDETW
jgi:metal-responsive CopG/Arc/MetJ family transcriptional regulator